MTHKEFIDRYKSGKLDVYVNRSNALRTINNRYVPNRYYWAHTFWSWVWMLSIPAGIIFLFFNLGIGIFILFFVSFLGGKAVKKSTMQFMIDHALENEPFYSFAIKSELIVIKPRETEQRKS